MKRLTLSPLIIIGIITLLLVYIIGFIQLVPYAGFRFDNRSGEVLLIFDETQLGVLQLGDQVQQIGSLSLEEFNDNLTAVFWDGVAPGNLVPITLLRDGEEITVYWRFTGYTPTELNNRIFSQWPLAFVFLMVGIITFNSVRPKNDMWLLMLVLNFSAAILFAVVSGAARSHFWYAAHMQHLSMWVMAPAMVHLHWLFPNPKKSSPAWVEKYLISAIYLASAPLLIFDLRNPAKNLYILGLLVSFIISFGLITYRCFAQKEVRRQIALVARFAFMALFPTTIVLFLYLLGFRINFLVEAAADLSLPLISVGYLFAVWQGEATPNQFRRNRLISLAIYSISLVPLSVVIVSLFSYPRNEIPLVTVAVLIISAGVLGGIFYNRFQRWVERVILGIPIPEQDLIDLYAKNLTNTDAPEVISALMESIVLPTLLVQQSALLEIQSQSLVGVLDYYGIEEDQIPKMEMLRKCIRHNNMILTPDFIEKLPPECQWVRVVMPLTFDSELIGVWLLGARDPDDLYPQQILSMLESIAQQTTFVIINHQKTTRLRALYQANIHRNEAERASLSRELHDETLNQIALLQREYQDPKLQESLDKITASLRKVIQGIRPDLLSFGLVTALDDLADSFNERSTSTQVETNLEGPPGSFNDLQDIELHIFRIVQQACENALRHADADTITIEGIVSQEYVDLVVRDDGKGFAGASSLDMTALIKMQKFGLFNMHERSDLIHADLRISSQVGKGTQVRLVWPVQSPI